MLKNLLAYFTLGTFLLAWPFALAATADDHPDDKESKHAKRGLAAQQNQLYKDRCGGCHLAYPPALLPSASWRKIMEGQASHFGEDLGLSPAEQRDLTRFLEAGAADQSSSRLARKVRKSLRGSIPLKITEVPYIIRKHQDDDIPRGAFQRKSIGSLANCGACHPGSASGDFDDDAVRIPAN
ncbi:MAG: diheme cytochrome c [Pseudomonadota bacterium]